MASGSTRKPWHPSLCASRRNPLPPPRLQTKQPENLLLRHPQTHRRAILSHDPLKHEPLMFQYLANSALNRVLGDEPFHKYGVLLSDPVGPVDRLIFHGRIPPAI